MLGISDKVTNWVRTNISGSDEASAYSRKSNVDQEYGRIQDGLDKVGHDIDNVDQDIQLKKVSLRNFKDSELIVGGGAVGAVAGAGLGLANSTVTSLLAKPSIEVVETKHDILGSTLKGFTFTEDRPGHEQPIYDPQTGQQTGTTTIHDKIVTHYQPTIEHKVLGSYTERSHVVHNDASGSPLTSGLIGLGIGFGVGAGVGTLVAVGRKAIGQGYDGHERQPVKNEAKKALQTTLVGTAIGAGVGLVNGYIESHNAISQSYNNETPVMINKELGQIPNDYERSLLSTNHQSPGTHAVNADVPKTNFLGRPVVDDHKIEAHVDGRFGLAGGIIGGAAVGAVAGFASGVAINIIRRAI